MSFFTFRCLVKESKIEHSKAAFVIAVSTGWEVSSPVWIVSVRDWEQSECRLWYVRTSPAPLSRTVQQKPKILTQQRSLNAVKLYTTEYYEMLLVITISTVEREWEREMTKKNRNNIKIKGSSIALLERLIPIIFHDISISSRRHPNSAEDLNKNKQTKKKKYRGQGNTLWHPHNSTSVCFIPGYAKMVTQRQLIRFPVTLPVKKNQTTKFKKCFGYRVGM